MNVHDTVLINIEGDLDLGNTSWSRGDTIEIELSQFVAILCHLSFTLKDLNEHSGLIVSIGGENLGFLGGDGSVSWDQYGHNLTGCLDSEGKGGNIQK